MTDRERRLVEAARPRLNEKTMKVLEELEETAEAMNNVSLKIGLGFLLRKEKNLQSALAAYDPLPITSAQDTADV